MSYYIENGRRYDLNDNDLGRATFRDRLSRLKTLGFRHRARRKILRLLGHK